MIDEKLEIIKTNPDPAARKEAAEAINRSFGEQVYNLWQHVDAVGHHLAAVRQRRRGATSCPTARRASAWPSPAATSINQMWCDDGDCE